MPVSLCTPEGKNAWLVCCVLDLCSVFVYAKTLGLFNHMLLWINEWTIFFLSHFSVFICGFVCMYMYTSRRTVPQYALQNDQLQFHTRVMSMTLITFENIVVFMCYSSACSGYKGWEWVGMCVWTCVRFCFSPVLRGSVSTWSSTPHGHVAAGGWELLTWPPSSKRLGREMQAENEQSSLYIYFELSLGKGSNPAQLFAHG